MYLDVIDIKTEETIFKAHGNFLLESYKKDRMKIRKKYYSFISFKENVKRNDDGSYTKFFIIRVKEIKP